MHFSEASRKCCLNVGPANRLGSIHLQHGRRSMRNRRWNCGAASLDCLKIFFAAALVLVRVVKEHLQKCSSARCLASNPFLFRQYRIETRDGEILLRGNPPTSVRRKAPWNQIVFSPMRLVDGGGVTAYEEVPCPSARTRGEGTLLKDQSPARTILVGLNRILCSTSTRTVSLLGATQLVEDH